MKRRTTALLFGILAMAGCQDMGLEYNLPLEEATDRPPMALVAAVMAPAATADRQLIVDGTLWVPSGLPLALDQQEVQPVGSSGGETVYARSWDRPPYDELFTRLPPPAPTDPLVFGPAEGEQYLSYSAIIGGGGPSATPVRTEDPPGSAAH